MTPKDRCHSNGFDISRIIGTLAALLSLVGRRFVVRSCGLAASGTRRSFEMDVIDRKILALYQHDTRRTAASIGEKVGLSAASVQLQVSGSHFAPTEQLQQR